MSKLIPMSSTPELERVQRRLFWRWAQVVRPVADGTAGCFAVPFARLSRFALCLSTRRLYANACFPTPVFRNSARWTRCVVTGRLSMRKYRHAFSNAGGVSRDVGYHSEGGSTRHPDTGSALPFCARPICRSRHFRPPYSHPARGRCAASKSVR